jgi:tetratricopeptide (TPR) repeat protein
LNAYAHAIELLQKGDKKEAETILLRLLNEDFENPVLLFALGMANVKNGRSGVANMLLKGAIDRMDSTHEAYEKLGIFPKESNKKDRKQFMQQHLAEAYNGLGMCHLTEDKLEMAKHYFETSLRLSPNHVSTHINMGVALNQEGRSTEANKFLNKALSLDANDEDAKWNIGLIQMANYEFEEGFKNYDEGQRARISLSRNYTYPDGTSLPMWDGSCGKRVLAFGEQGIGDEIMFASCIPELMAMSEQVIFDCHPRLLTLFERSFGVKCYPTRKKEWLDWVMDYKFDCRAALGSLGRYLRKTEADFPGTPYLKAGRNADVDGMPGFKVGISWRGGIKETKAAFRSIPLSLWKPILEQDATFISLQYLDCRQEIADVERQIGKTIHEFDFVTDQKSDYDLHAEIVNSCDLIISVNTSLIHLSGALGKDCWIMTPSHPAWRYGAKGSHMPWYKSNLQFRQKKGEDWMPVINTVAERLRLCLSDLDRKVA